MAGDPAVTRWLDADDPIAFEDIVGPMVDRASEVLQIEAGAALGAFAAPTLATMERALLAMLSAFAGPVLASEFALHRARDALPGTRPHGLTREYRRFVAAMAAGGTDAVMRAYSVLARVLASWSEGWVRSHRDLAWHLHDDRAVLGVGDEAVVGVAPCLSDPHEPASSVTALRFARGATIAYKPRSLAMEAGFGDLLDWVNARGFSRPFRVPRVIDRGDHGWMDWAAPAPCPTTAAVTDFHMRIGGLICLVALLQGSDIHHENLIAAGEHPVIVDLETLFHPRLSPAIGAMLGAGAGRARADERVGTLVDSGFFAPPDALDFSALGGGVVDTPFRVRRSVRVNSDTMDMTTTGYRAPARPNVPILDGRPQRAADFRGAILDGYREMAGLVRRDRVALADRLEGFAGLSCRMVVRASNIYGLLIQAATEPPAMRDPAARHALVLRGLAPQPGLVEGDGVHAILDAELRALERMTVPRLMVRCDRAGPGWRAPLDEVRDRIARLDEAVVDCQTRWIAATLAGTGQGKRDRMR